MKIAYIAVKGIPIGGGIEKLTEEIGSRMVSKGHEVVVYCSRDYGTSDGTFNGMEIRTVPSVNSKSLHKLSRGALPICYFFCVFSDGVSDKRILLSLTERTYDQRAL